MTYEHTLSFELEQDRIHEEPKLHRALKNPKVTQEVDLFSRCSVFNNTRPTIKQVLKKIVNKEGFETKDYHDKPVYMSDFFVLERILLDNWDFKDRFNEFVDAPLVAHAGAAINLEKRGYDAVVGIMNDGLPYSNLFESMGFPTFCVNYSHRKQIPAELGCDGDLDELKKKSKVLLVDIDFMTGKTFEDVHDYLTDRDVNVAGVYTGLFNWPGKRHRWSLDANGVFYNDSFREWDHPKSPPSILLMRNWFLEGRVSKEIEVYAPNPAIDQCKGYAPASIYAQKVARYCLKKNFPWINNQVREDGYRVQHSENFKGIKNLKTFKIVPK